jgi:hypothetical protein
MISLTLQCCPVDTEETLSLVRLICDIEPELRRGGEFFLVYRKDTAPYVAKEFERLASQKFERVAAREARNFDVGWPAGSNMLAGSAFIAMTILQRTGLCEHSAFLLFEPDCIPLAANWLDLLSAEWDRAFSLGFESFGHHHQQFDETTKHQNGNAVFRTDWFDRHPNWIIGPGLMGWDYFYREQILSVSTDSNLIHQLYNTYGFTPEEFDSITKNGERPAFLHGIKTPHGRQIARERLASQKTLAPIGT